MLSAHAAVLRGLLRLVVHESTPVEFKLMATIEQEQLQLQIMYHQTHHTLPPLPGLRMNAHEVAMPEQADPLSPHLSPPANVNSKGHQRKT